MRPKGATTATVPDLRLALIAVALAAAMLLPGCSYTPQTMTTTTQQTSSQVVPGQTSVTVTKTQQTP
jgi:uncharacterized lipoprotein YajG